jgi:DNA mismatch repair protein MutL
MIRVLDEATIDKIAAGEVVERPASVVKELVENAVDAGAKAITVECRDGGIEWIRITDDGCGIPSGEVRTAFLRHATSKIKDATDLSALLSLGFRGEALSSICAVSRVEIITKTPDALIGTRMEIEGGKETSFSEVGAPNGTTILVRNLFYNTPARRKFLKSDNIELKHIVEEFTRVALTCPEAGFSLNSNGRDIFRLRPAKSLKFRVLDLLGSNVTGDLVDITAETSLVRVRGFLARPDTARKTVANQFFFVNGRYFRSSYMHKAVMKAYEEYLPEGYTPSYFIWLEVDPEAVDVNIHPTKAEVKFEEDAVIFQTIYACVKETLGKNAFGEGLDFDTEGRVEMPQMGSAFDEYRGPASSAPAPPLDPDYNPFASPDSFASPDLLPTGASLAKLGSFASLGMTGVSSRTREAGEGIPSYRNPAESAGYGALFEQNQAAQAKALIVKGKYIIAPSASGVLLVHIRRAWERILYERSLKALSKNVPVTQTALFPVQVQVGASARLLFDENAAMLASVGFDISPFGTDTVVVNGVPEGYSCEPGKVQQMVQDLLLILSDETSGVPEVVRAALASKFATLGSVNAEPPRNALEAQQLIDSLFACENAELTATGKKITAVMSTDDLEKRFQ